MPNWRPSMRGSAFSMARIASGSGALLQLGVDESLIGPGRVHVRLRRRDAFAGHDDRLDIAQILRRESGERLLRDARR